jgi:hypothetical protein
MLGIYPVSKQLGISRVVLSSMELIYVITVWGCNGTVLEALSVMAVNSYCLIH